jgi:hypothetical protein
MYTNCTFVSQANAKWCRVKEKSPARGGALLLLAIYLSPDIGNFSIGLLRKLGAAGVPRFVGVDAVLRALGGFHRLVIHMLAFGTVYVGRLAAAGFNRFMRGSCSGFGGI